MFEQIGTVIIVIVVLVVGAGLGLFAGFVLGRHKGQEMARGVKSEELEEAKRGIARLGGRVEKTETYDIAGAPRCVIVIRTERPTPPAYPRRYAKIKQSPL